MKTDETAQFIGIIVAMAITRPLPYWFLSADAGRAGCTVEFPLSG